MSIRTAAANYALILCSVLLLGFENVIERGHWRAFEGLLLKCVLHVLCTKGKKHKKKMPVVKWCWFIVLIFILFFSFYNIKDLN